MIHSFEAREHQVDQLAPRLARIAIDGFVRDLAAENLAQDGDAIAQDWGDGDLGFGEAEAGSELAQSLARDRKRPLAQQDQGFRGYLWSHQGVPVAIASDPASERQLREGRRGGSEYGRPGMLKALVQKF